LVVQIASAQEEGGQGGNSGHNGCGEHSGVQR
jgi:hypothetical protein